MNDVPVYVLKDDVCNTSVISKEFFEKHAECLDVAEKKVEVCHSNKGNTEFATKVVLNARLKCGKHVYRSNFAVANCRCDVLLGMPWHVDCNPTIEYEVPTVAIADHCLPMQSDDSCSPVITNMGVKKFRSMLRKKGNRDDFHVFAVVENPNKATKGRDTAKGNEKLAVLLQRYQ